MADRADGPADHPGYTTNAVESLHRSLRKVIKTRGSFPTGEAAIKLLHGYAVSQKKRKRLEEIYCWPKTVASQRETRLHGRMIGEPRPSTPTESPAIPPGSILAPGPIAPYGGDRPNSSSLFRQPADPHE